MHNFVMGKVNQRFSMHTKIICNGGSEGVIVIFVIQGAFLDIEHLLDK